MTEDWSDAISALLEAGAGFLVVGAHALAVHGVPRATQNLGVWVEPTDENAVRVWEAFVRFDAPLEELGVTTDDFVRPETVVQLGLPPNRIDVLTGIRGVERFSETWDDRVEREIAGRVVPFLGRTTLIANKLATGRLEDRADVEALGEDT